MKPAYESHPALHVSTTIRLRPVHHHLFLLMKNLLKLVDG